MAIYCCDGDFVIGSNNVSPVEEFRMIESLIEYSNERLKKELTMLHSSNIRKLLEFDKKLYDEEKEKSR